MYQEIEREYKKRINLKLLKITIVFSIILLTGIAIGAKGNFGLQIILSIMAFVLIVSVIYLIFVISKKLPQKFKIKANIEQAIKEKQERNAQIFDQILKENHITREKQIREVMEYYKLKIPQKRDSSLLTCFWEIGISIITLFLTCIIFRGDGTLDSMITGKLLSMVLALVLILIFIILLVGTLKELYIDLFDKYDVYETFVEILSEKLVHMIEKENQVQSVEKNVI